MASNYLPENQEELRAEMARAIEETVRFLRFTADLVEQFRATERPIDAALVELFEEVANAACELGFAAKEIADRLGVHV